MLDTNWQQEHSRDGAEERTVTVALERLDRLVGQGHTLLLERLKTGVEMRKGELQAETRWQSFEDAAACGDDLAANAVAWNEACTKISFHAPRRSGEDQLGVGYRCGGYEPPCLNGLGAGEKLGKFFGVGMHVGRWGSVSDWPVFGGSAD